jgi:protein-disulfide isomerase
MKDYSNSLVHGITGTPTTFINGELYAMSGIELLAAVRASLNAPVRNRE